MLVQGLGRWLSWHCFWWSSCAAGASRAGKVQQSRQAAVQAKEPPTEFQSLEAAPRQEPLPSHHQNPAVVISPKAPGYMMVQAALNP